MNPFSQLSEYELHHLLRHLGDNNRREEIHTILSLQTEEGKNAWFEIKQKKYLSGEFMSDIVYVFNAIVNNYTDSDHSLILALRYCLIISSLSSIYGKIPTPLIVELVKKGLWDFSQVLEVNKNSKDSIDILALIPVLSSDDVKQFILFFNKAFDDKQKYINYVERCVFRLLELNELSDARNLINLYKLYLPCTIKVNYLLKKISNLRIDEYRARNLQRLINFWLEIKNLNFETREMRFDYFNVGIALAKKSSAEMRKIIIDRCLTFYATLVEHEDGRIALLERDILPLISFTSTDQIIKFAGEQGSSERNRYKIFLGLVKNLPSDQRQKISESIFQGDYKSVFPGGYLDPKYMTLDAPEILDLIQNLPEISQQKTAKKLMGQAGTYPFAFPLASLMSWLDGNSNLLLSSGYREYLSFAKFLPKNEQNKIYKKAISQVRTDDIHSLAEIIPLVDAAHKKEILSNVLRQLDNKNIGFFDLNEGLEKKDENHISFVSTIAPYITNVEDLEAILLSLKINDEQAKNGVLSRLFSKGSEENSFWDCFDQISDMLKDINDITINLSTIRQLISKSPRHYLPIFSDMVAGISTGLKDYIKDSSILDVDKSEYLCLIALRYAELGDIDESIRLLKRIKAIREDWSVPLKLVTTNNDTRFPDEIFFKYVDVVLRSKNKMPAINLLFKKLPNSKALRILLDENTIAIFEDNQDVIFEIIQSIKQHDFDFEEYDWLVKRLHNINRIDDAIDIIKKIKASDKKVNLLLTLISRLDLQKRDWLVKWAFEEVWRIRVNGLLVIHSEKRAKIIDPIINLLPLLSDRQISEGMHRANEISDKLIKAEVLSVLATRLNQNEREKVISQSIEIALSSNYTRLFALSSVAPYMPNPMREKIIQEYLTSKNIRELSEEINYIVQRMIQLGIAEDALDIAFKHLATSNTDNLGNFVEKAIGSGYLSSLLRHMKNIGLTRQSRLLDEIFRNIPKPINNESADQLLNLLSFVDNTGVRFPHYYIEIMNYNSEKIGKKIKTSILKYFLQKKNLGTLNSRLQGDLETLNSLLKNFPDIQRNKILHYLLREKIPNHETSNGVSKLSTSLFPLLCDEHFRDVVDLIENKNIYIDKDEIQEEISSYFSSISLDLQKEFLHRKLNQWINLPRSVVLSEIKYFIDLFLNLAQPQAALGVLQVIKDVRKWWA